MAVCIEYVNKAVARSSNIVVLLRVLLGVGDEQVAIEAFDAERREARRDIRIDEAPFSGRRLVVVVENIDRAGPEIGGVDEVTIDIDPEGEAFVNGASSRARRF